MEELQEKTLHREAARIEIAKAATPFEDIDPEVQLAVRCAADKKAFDIRVLDLREVATFTEFFIIAGGSNQRQVQAIADEITEQLKKQLSTLSAILPAPKTGMRTQNFDRDACCPEGPGTRSGKFDTGIAKYAPYKP